MISPDPPPLGINPLDLVQQVPVDLGPGEHLGEAAGAGGQGGHVLHRLDGEEDQLQELIGQVHQLGHAASLVASLVCTGQLELSEINTNLTELKPNICGMFTLYLSLISNELISEEEPLIL